MPTYRYRCDRDGLFEEHRSIHVDSTLAVCPDCGLEASKVIVAPYLSGVGPRLTGPPAGNRNSWEKGIATDHRGAPLMGPTGPISVKSYAQHRHEYEEKRRELASHPDPFGGVALQTRKDGN